MLKKPSLFFVKSEKSKVKRRSVEGSSSETFHLSRLTPKNLRMLADFFSMLLVFDLRFGEVAYYH